MIFTEINAVDGGRWKERCRQCKRGGQTERVSEGDADRESETES